MRSSISSRFHLQRLSYLSVAKPLFVRGNCFSVDLDREELALMYYFDDTSTCNDRSIYRLKGYFAIINHY